MQNSVIIQKYGKRAGANGNKKKNRQKDNDDVKINESDEELV